MKDLFNNYHKHKVLSNFGMFAAAFVFALSINMFLLNGEDAGKFKANLREINTQSENLADFIGKARDNELVFSNSKAMSDLTEISFSLTYDSEEVILNDFQSNDNVTIASMNNSPGFSSYIISFSEPLEVAAHTEIIKIPYTKTPGVTVHLNPVNVNFTDSIGNTYSLSSSGLIF